MNYIKEKQLLPNHSGNICYIKVWNQITVQNIDSAV